MDAATVLTGVATVCAAIAIVQTYRANRVARRIAEVQGQLSSPELQVSFIGHPLNTSFVIAAPLREGRVLALPISCVIKNNGAKTAREIELYLRMSKELLFGGSGLTTFELKSPLENLRCKMVASTANLETLLVSIPAINPGAGLGWTSEWSLVNDTTVDSKVAVPWKDGDVTVPVVMEFAWHVTLLLAQADRPPISGSISLQVLDTKGVSAAQALNAHNERTAHDLRGRGTIPASSIKPVVVIVIAAEDLVPDSKWPIDRPKTESLKCYPGHKTPLGLLVPGLNLVPVKP